MKPLYTLLALFVMLGSTVSAQNFMNFQGKVNQPGVTTTNTLNFEIPELGWTQPFLGNVTVANGLFSVTLNLPTNVFDSAHATRQLIVKLNGALLDTFTVLAPVERDPTVRGYVRDSVQWVNIRNKPTVDTSVTNELQVLSISKDTLRLSNGNYVILPRASDTVRNLAVNGRFTVLDTTVSIMTTVPFVGTTMTGTAYWQSFKATANGKLRSLKVNLSSTSGSVTIRFYNGIGGAGSTAAAGTLLLSSIPSASTNVILPLAGLGGGTSNVSLAIGQLYTIEIVANGGTITILTDPANPYPDGIAGPGLPASTDIPFELGFDKSDPPCLTFDNNCRVGIGTAAPTAQLEVNGRIKDQTGFVMPVGTIISYAGRSVPQGWLLCDGAPVSRIVYPDLYQAIDSSWGAGNSTTTFNVPDLRGRFIRGVDYSPTRGATGNDPEYTLRTAINLGGNTGNNVGTLQGDQIKSHTHAVWGPNLNISTSLGGGHFSVYSYASHLSGPSGGNESRPKNAAVYFIIKY